MKTGKTETTPAQQEQPKTTVTAVNTKSNINFSGGYFKNLYDQQTANKPAVTQKWKCGSF